MFKFPIFYDSRSTHFILKIFSYLIKEKFYSMLKNRASIISLYFKNIRKCDIARRLDICRMLVSRALKRFHELGNTQDRPSSGWPVTEVTSENMNVVRCRIRRFSEQSMWKTASDLGMSSRSFLRIVRVKLRLRATRSVAHISLLIE